MSSNSRCQQNYCHQHLHISGIGVSPPVSGRRLPGGVGVRYYSATLSQAVILSLAAPPAPELHCHQSNTGIMVKPAPEQLKHLHFTSIFMSPASAYRHRHRAEDGGRKIAGGDGSAVLFCDVEDGCDSKKHSVHSAIIVLDQEADSCDLGYTVFTSM